MKEFQTKHKDLSREVNRKITTLIAKHGVESAFQNEKVLKVTQERLQFTLDGSHYLTEISNEELIDQSGYTYSYDVLTLEQLCELVDFFLEFK
jgi:hypothetical protein